MRIPLPPLTPEKVAQYTGLFERQNLQGGGMLPGDQAKQIFEKSGLPNEILGRVWQLADTEMRGALVLTEFVIAMHLLTSLKTGALRGLPNMIPAALYEAATRRGLAAAPRQQSPTGASPTVSAIPRQLSGQAHMRTGSPLGRPPLQAQSTGGDWLVKPEEKINFDRLYAELDKTQKGFITGEEAVPFLSQSKLPEDVLAQIWDLSDVRSEGQLNRDTFAVAMYLIRQVRRDGTSALPTVLPNNLKPPGMRSQAPSTTAASISSAFDAPPPQTPAPAPAPVPAPQPKSALDDLFGLDASSPPAATLQSSMPTGGSASAITSGPFAGSSPLRPSSPAKPSPISLTPSFKPFMPTSSFGRTLTQQVTGDSNGSSPSFTRTAPQPIQPPQPASAQDDLLGDTGAETSKKLNNESTELANLSNQVGSLTKHMQEVQGQRTATQNELNQANVQKKNFEQRLAQLRALYEREAKDVRTLEEQLNASRNETRKVQTETAMLEGTYQDLQNQHHQVSTALQADRDENASLKERIRIVNAEIAQLKPQVEKLRSEARQQKGLVAINKKQLATTEGERDKMKTEVEDLTKSNEELARQISMNSPNPAGTAQVASPALSTASGNNPFFKRTGSTDLMGAFASTSPPPAKSFNDNSFDDVFGPTAFSVPAHTTGTSTGSAASFATPTTSTPNVSRQPTAAIEPPAPPPESRQTSSNVLPFSDATSESLTPSRQISPPLSRAGHAEAAGAEPASPRSIEAAAVSPSITSGSETTKNAATYPAAAKPASNGEDILGAKPAEDGAKTIPSHAHNDSLGDHFSAIDQAKAKEDFESAFASFKSGKAAKGPEGLDMDASKSIATFTSEFPPIEVLEKPEEPNSDSEHAGFDDDFAPASPKAAEKNRSIQPASLSQARTEVSPAVAADKSVIDFLDRYEQS